MIETPTRRRRKKTTTTQAIEKLFVLQANAKKNVHLSIQYIAACRKDSKIL